MADSGAANEDTAATSAGKTIAVPSSAPKEAVELAWSQGDDGGDHADDQGISDSGDDIQSASPAAVHQSWRNTFGNAGALLLVGLGAAGVIMLGSWALTKEDPSKTAAPVPATRKNTTSAPATATSPAQAAPSTTPDKEVDDKYLQDLKDRGISFANPGAAVYNGKIVCQNLGQGMTVPQVVDAFQASSPAVGIDVNAYVAISVRTFCPEYREAVAGF